MYPRVIIIDILVLCCWTFWICRKAGETDGFIDTGGYTAFGCCRFRFRWWIWMASLLVSRDRRTLRWLFTLVCPVVSVTVLTADLLKSDKEKQNNHICECSIYVYSMYALHQLRSSSIFLYGIFIYILWNKLLNKLSMLHELAKKKWAYIIYSHIRTSSNIIWFCVPEPRV